MTPLNCLDQVAKKIMIVLDGESSQVYYWVLPTIIIRDDA